jgi:hypothetical protein
MVLRCLLDDFLIEKACFVVILLDIIKKTCMLFCLFVRNADMPAGLRFLQNLMNVQSSNLKVQSIAKKRGTNSLNLYLDHESLLSIFCVDDLKW